MGYVGRGVDSGIGLSEMCIDGRTKVPTHACLCVGCGYVCRVSAMCVGCRLCV